MDALPTMLAYAIAKPLVKGSSPRAATAGTAGACTSVVAPAPETSTEGKQEQDSLTAMLQVEWHKKHAEQDKVHSIGDAIIDTADASSSEEPTPRSTSDEVVCRALVCPS